MAFGKRGLPRATRGPVGSPAQEIIVDPSKSVAGRLGWIAVGAVAAFIVIAGINALILMQIGRNLDESWARPLGTKSISKNFVSSDLLSRQLQSRCKEPKFGFSLYQPAHLNDAQVELARKVRHANELTNYIVCSMRTARQRYCTKQARLDLAEQIRAYLRLRKEALHFARHLQSQPISRYDRIQQRLARNDNLERRVIIPDTTISQVDPRLLSELQLLVHDGYFSAGDFGGFLWSAVPPEIAPSIDGWVAQKVSCQ